MPPVPAEVPCLPCARLQARAGGHDVICGKTPGVFANGRPSKQCDACRHGHKACRKVPCGAIVFALKLQQIAVGAEGDTPLYKKYAKVFRAAYHALPPAEIEDSDPVILDTIRLSELIKERTYAARDAEIMGEQLRGVKRKLDDMLEAVEETLAAVGQEE